MAEVRIFTERRVGMVFMSISALEMRHLPLTFSKATKLRSNSSSVKN
ncbi:Uncharacterised protein [Mycobacteroides abscessus subsp. massiliense]|nr:Uncharacterised protein [Mycobacteroides abscessus subsp. massiliense]